VVSRQLALWGDGRDAEARPRTARLERDLERVLEDLADDFPLLRSLVDRRAGGQKRLPMPGAGDERVPAPLFTSVPGGDDIIGEGANLETRPSAPSSDTARGSPQENPPSGDHALPGNEASGEQSDGQPRAQIAAPAGMPETIGGRRRPARYGLQVQFESRPEDTELGRLVDSTIWINDAHPAYSRALASRSLGYHTALAVALALAPLAVETRDEHAFITQFLAHWGSTHTAKGIASRRRGRTDRGDLLEDRNRKP
jgi:hypothetical protein